MRDRIGPVLFGVAWASITVLAHARFGELGVAMAMAMVVALLLLAPW